MEMVEEARTHDTFAEVGGDNDIQEHHNMICSHESLREHFSGKLPTEGIVALLGCRHLANIFSEFLETDSDTC